MSAIAAPRGRLFTVAQAAQFLGVTPRRVRSLLERREITAMRTEGGRLEGLYEADLRVWQEQRRQPAIDPTRRGAQLDVDRRTRELPGADYFTRNA